MIVAVTAAGGAVTLWINRHPISQFFHPKIVLFSERDAALRTIIDLKRVARAETVCAEAAEGAADAWKASARRIDCRAQRCTRRSAAEVA